MSFLLYFLGASLHQHRTSALFNAKNIPMAEIIFFALNKPKKNKARKQPGLKLDLAADLAGLTQL
jgi:hypothetical protein